MVTLRYLFRAVVPEAARRIDSCLSNGSDAQRPAWLGAQAGRFVGDRVSLPLRDRGQPLVGLSLRARSCSENRMGGRAPTVVVATQAVRWMRRISDTRVLRVPAATNVGMALSVERDATARPVHDRSRVRDGVEGRRSAHALVCLTPKIMAF